MKTKHLRRHIRKIRFYKLLAIFLALIAVGSFASSVYLTEYYYQQWLNPTGENSLVQAESIVRAIDLRPTRAEGYHKLLDVFLEDSLLSKKENGMLQELFNEQQERLNKVPSDAADLYSRTAFSYICCYDADAMGRLKAACRYFQLTQPYQDEDGIKETARASYVEIATYCTQYVWRTGSLQEPEEKEISEMIRRFSAMLDIYQDGADRDRLAYACSLAMLLTEHGTMWAEKVGVDTISRLTEKIEMQTLADTKDPAAVRLLEELTTWKNETKAWEVAEQ